MTKTSRQTRAVKKWMASSDSSRGFWNYVAASMPKNGFAELVREQVHNHFGRDLVPMALKGVVNELDQVDWNKIAEFWCEEK